MTEEDEDDNKYVACGSCLLVIVSAISNLASYFLWGHCKAREHNSLYWHYKRQAASAWAIVFFEGAQLFTVQMFCLWLTL